jgi:hypothetical protein
VFRKVPRKICFWFNGLHRATVLPQNNPIPVFYLLTSWELGPYNGSVQWEMGLINRVYFIQRISAFFSAFSIYGKFDPTCNIYGNTVRTLSDLGQGSMNINELVNYRQPLPASWSFDFGRLKEWKLYADGFAQYQSYLSHAPHIKPPHCIVLKCLKYMCKSSTKPWFLIGKCWGLASHPVTSSPWGSCLHALQHRFRRKDGGKMGKRDLQGATIVS